MGKIHKQLNMLITFQYNIFRQDGANAVNYYQICNIGGYIIKLFEMLDINLPCSKKKVVENAF